MTPLSNLLRLATLTLLLSSSLLGTVAAGPDDPPLLGIHCGPSPTADGPWAFACSTGSLTLPCAEFAGEAGIDLTRVLAARRHVALASLRVAEAAECGPAARRAGDAFALATTSCDRVDAMTPLNIGAGDADGGSRSCGVHGTGIPPPPSGEAASIIICWYDQWGYWNCIIVEGQGPGLLTL